MKSLFPALLMVSVFSVYGFSECSYFRVSLHLQTCAAADPKTLKASDPYPSPSEVSDLDEPASQTFAHVSCSCDYSLTGADPRCDTDQTIERSSVVGTANPAQFCLRGASVCKDVCPARLP